MSQETVQHESAGDDEGIAMFDLYAAIPKADMPPALLELASKTSGRLRAQDIRSLDAAERKKVLAVVERAVEYYREKSRGYRTQTNPVQRTVERFESLLEASRK